MWVPLSLTFHIKKHTHILSLFVCDCQKKSEGKDKTENDTQKKNDGNKKWVQDLGIKNEYNLNTNQADPKWLILGFKYYGKQSLLLGDQHDNLAHLW